MSRSSSFPVHLLFHDTAATEIYTLSLHDALPISPHYVAVVQPEGGILEVEPAIAAQSHSRPPQGRKFARANWCERLDRKSTRLNSSHLGISYAVFCLKKKKNKTTPDTACCYWTAD